MNRSDEKSTFTGSAFRFAERHSRLLWIGLKNALLPIVLAGLILLLLSCSATEELEDREVDIRGTIVEVHRMGTLANDSEAILGSVLIEGAIEADTKYDKAAITITAETAIYEQQGEERIKATFADVAEGQLAEVTFAGPVRETYPLQGSAAELVILK